MRQCRGSKSASSVEVLRLEGTAVKLTAPTSSSVGPFLYWRYDGGISFGRGVDTVSLALLRNATVTAVYQGRRHEPPQGPGLPPLRDRFEALRQCLAVDCLGLLRDREGEGKRSDDRGR